MVLLWKGLLTNQNQSLSESQNRPEQLKKTIDDSRNIYDSFKDYDSLKDNDWSFKERLKLKDNHQKNGELEDWF